MFSQKSSQFGNGMSRLAFSIAVVCMVTAAPAWAVVTYSPQVGGNGGSPFTLNCPAGKVLIGIRGRSGGFVDRVEGICANIDSNMRRSDISYTGRRGGNGGSPFELRCPAGTVVVGLVGRSASYVDRIGLRCAPLNTSGLRTRNPAFAGASSGGTGGYQYTIDCPGSVPARGIRGRSASWIDKIGLTCEPPIVRRPGVTVPPAPVPPTPPAPPSPPNDGSTGTVVVENTNDSVFPEGTCQLAGPNEVWVFYDDDANRVVDAMPASMASNSVPYPRFPRLTGLSSWTIDRGRGYAGNANLVVNAACGGQRFVTAHLRVFNNNVYPILLIAGDLENPGVVMSTSEFQVNIEEGQLPNQGSPGHIRGTVEGVPFFFQPDATRIRADGITFSFDAPIYPDSNY